MTSHRAEHFSRQALSSFCFSRMPARHRRQISPNLSLLKTGAETPPRAGSAKMGSARLKAPACTADWCLQRNMPAFVLRTSRADGGCNDRTDMVFISDFSVNRTQNELLSSLGIMAVFRSGISSQRPCDHQSVKQYLRKHGKVPYRRPTAQIRALLW